MAITNVAEMSAGNLRSKILRLVVLTAVFEAALSLFLLAVEPVCGALGSYLQSYDRQFLARVLRPVHPGPDPGFRDFLDGIENELAQGIWNAENVSPPP